VEEFTGGDFEFGRAFDFAQDMLKAIGPEKGRSFAWAPPFRVE